jgi:hypothetical protein
LLFDAESDDVVLTKSSHPNESDKFEYEYYSEAYRTTLFIHSPQQLISRLIVVCGFDSSTNTLTLGRHSTSGQVGIQEIPYGSGSLSLSK